MPKPPFGPELDQPMPRHVRLREGLGAGWTLWGPRVFILPHTVVGVGLLAGAIWTTLLFRPIEAVLVWWGVALFWNGFLFLFLRSAYWHPRRQRTLVRWGSPVAGIIRTVERWEYKGINVRVTYEYAIGDGAAGVFKGSMKAAVPEAATVQVGDVVTVLNLPKRPKWSLVYPLVAYKAV